MMHRPFKLDNLSHLPRYLEKGSFQTTLDDKSGYDHILLDEPSQTALLTPLASEFRLKAAKVAVFLAGYTLTCLG